MLPPILIPLFILIRSGLVAADSSITWLHHQRSAVVKLDTPGYPFKEASEAHGSDREAPLPGAVVLKFQISADNKTLLLQDEPFLPLQNYYSPPRLSAHQVPADMDKETMLTIAKGSEGSQFLVGQSVELDYDRLVEGDPAGGPPFYNHAPILRFRIMGLGANGADHILDAGKQEIIQIALGDQNHGASNDPLRSYAISSLQVLSAKKVYAELSTEDHMGPEADQERECTRRNWKCSDGGVFEAGSPYRTPYRFIWRKRFDEFGRIGSLRHDVMEQWEASKQKAYEDPRNSALVALGVLLATILAIVGGVKSRAQSNVPVEEPAAEPAKKDISAGKVEDEEPEESEDEDGAWLAEQAQQAGEVPMTIDEASQLIDMMSDDDEDEDIVAVKKKIKNKNKRVAFKSNVEE